MTLCHNIETLSMAFLDDELVAEDRRELELHLLDCASCRQRGDAERADLGMIRKALVAPPASALLKARIGRALGRRLLPNGIANDDAAMRPYLVDEGAERLGLTAVVLTDLRSDALSDGEAYQAGGLVLRVHDAAGLAVVTYIDPVRRVGYGF